MDWVSANRGEIYQTSGSNERGSLEVNSTIKEESLQMSTMMFKHNISASPPLPGVCVLAQSFQSCPTLCNPRDYSPPGCCVHGIQASQRSPRWRRDCRSSGVLEAECECGGARLFWKLASRKWDQTSPRTGD